MPFSKTIAIRPKFPFETFQSVLLPDAKNKNINKLIISRFLEQIIGKFYMLNEPFKLRSISLLQIEQYKTYIINKHLLFYFDECYLLNDNLDSKLQNPDQIRTTISLYANSNNLNPVYAYLYYGNTLLNSTIPFGRSTGFLLIDRKELSEFFKLFELDNTIWNAYILALEEIETHSNSIQIEAITTNRYSAEGFFMRIDKVLSTKGYESSWFYDVYNNLILDYGYSSLSIAVDISIKIINNGELNLFVEIDQDTWDVILLEKFQDFFRLETATKFNFVFHPLERGNDYEQYLFKVSGIDWEASQDKIIQNLIAFRDFVIFKANLFFE